MKPSAPLHPAVKASPRTIGWRALQVLLLIATLAFAAREIARQWDALRMVARDTQLHWGWIAVSGMVVLAVHTVLIQTWRALLAGWGGELRFGSAVRIWTVSNLGKYLPGKVWSIGALGMLAEREGVSGVTAASAALLNAVLNLGAGFGVVALAGAGEIHRVPTWVRTVAVVSSLLFLIGVAVLPRILPPMLMRLSKWRCVEPHVQQLAAGTLWRITALHALSWVGYGLAFQAFARGVTPHIAGAPVMFVAVYSASYLFGYLMLFAPGGIGVRETAIVWLLLASGLALRADAIFLSLASRVWLTAVEVLPGVISLAWTVAARWAAARSER